MATNISASEYLSKSETKLRTFKREWESFTTEAPQKFFSLVKSGIKPTVSRGPSVPGQISVSLNFESNMDAAKAYVEKIRDTIEDKKDEISNHIKDMDKKIQLYLDEGVDGDTFSKLVKNMNEWIAYIPKMSFKIGNNDINIKVDDSIIKIKKKWEEVSAEEVRKKEAEKYGVQLELLDTHKKYLAAIKIKKSGKTSKAVKDAKKAFLLLNGYLDSEKLALECDPKIKKLLEKEAEEKRIAAEKKAEEERKKAEEERSRKAKEEEKKRKKEESKRKAEEKKKQEIDANKVIVQKCLDQIDEYKTQVKLAVNENKNKITARIMQKIEQLKSEKQSHEATMKSLGLFNFFDKKREKEEIARIETEIQLLSNPGYLSDKLKKVLENGDLLIKKYEYAVKEFLEKKYNMDYQITKKVNNDPEKVKLVDFSSLSREEQKNAIVKVFEKERKALSVAGVQEKLKKLYFDIPFNTVNALTRALKLENKIIRTVNKEGKAYFTWADRRKTDFSKKSKGEPYTVNKEYIDLQCPEIPIIEEFI